MTPPEFPEFRVEGLRFYVLGLLASDFWVPGSLKPPETL